MRPSRLRMPEAPIFSFLEAYEDLNRSLSLYIYIYIYIATYILYRHLYIAKLYYVATYVAIYPQELNRGQESSENRCEPPVAAAELAAALARLHPVIVPSMIIIIVVEVAVVVVVVVAVEVVVAVAVAVVSLSLV